MELHDAIYGRRAVREYLPKPIDQSVIKSLIDAAVQAPSAVNQQPWTFTVVRSERVLDQLSHESKAHMLKSHPGIRESEHFHLLNDPHFQIFYHAPVLVIISAVAPALWFIEDCALAAQNLMLAAYDEGLGSCWIGFAQGYLNTSEGKAPLAFRSPAPRLHPSSSGSPKGKRSRSRARKRRSAGSHKRARGQ